MVCLNVGCHDIHMEGFINIDLDEAMKPDLLMDVKNLKDKFSPGSVDFIYCGHLLEHLTVEDGKQLIRSSGSVGANYIEASEALSKKDFLMRIKICRKEAKESRYWLRLVDTNKDNELENERKSLEKEATELTHIFGSIVTKSQ